MIKSPNHYIYDMIIFTFHYKNVMIIKIIHNKCELNLNRRDQMSERWIWQKEDYPNFTYDRKVIDPLVQEISLQQGQLIAFTSILNNENLKLRQLESLSSEVINTSAIEGEALNRESVRASIKKKLGIENISHVKSDIEVDGIVEILIDANTNYKEDLSLEKLFGWHNALFPRGYSGMLKINVASFRGSGDMEVVKGGIGGEKRHYLAPPRQNVQEEIERFLKWFNKKDASVLKAAIAHLWFLIIHPFDDGNGRITRAITDLTLSEIESSKISKLYSMSTTIFKNRTSYYKVLDATTGFGIKNNKGLDITDWIVWFLRTLLESLQESKKSLNYILEKTVFWDNHKNSDLNVRQIKVLNKILDIGVENFEGGLNNKKYRAITKAIPTTASRDLKELVNKGCIVQKEGTKGRNISYLVKTKYPSQ